MDGKTAKITKSAMFSALAAVFLYIASVFPTGQVGFVALASFTGVAAVIECGIGGGAAVYICASLLSFLIAPNKAPVYLYMIFFGYYPILKSVAESRKSRVFEWALKILLFLAAAYLSLGVFSFLTLPKVMENVSLPIILLVLLAVYIIFDIGITKLIFFYMTRVKQKTKKR